MDLPQSPLSIFFADRSARASLKALAWYLLAVALLIGIYSALFHVIKLGVEGEDHRWIDGVYWTIVTMTTLGYGDVTFTSTVGRIFSLVVLLSGLLSLVVLLPFMFVRLVYAPWLEASLRTRAPQQVPDGTRGHVIVTRYDEVAAAVLERLRVAGIRGYVIEGDPVEAARLADNGVPVVAGERDSRATYERMAVGAARLVFANGEDTSNTNVTLTVREIDPAVPIAAIAESDDAVDILALSGATTVLPLKQRLGEQLANRVDMGPSEAHVIGSILGVQIAELPARYTPLAGVAVRETRLRERTGASVIALWKRGRLETARPDTQIQDDSVAVVAGTDAQIAALNALLPRHRTPAPVLVIGAGRVGQAAMRSLTRKGLTVYAIDRDAAALETIEADERFPGDASNRALVERAGIGRVSTVLLTTNDDGMNIYLAVHCRRLNPHTRIVSRITHERNVEAVHRAGADFVLGYTSLAAASAIALLNGRAPVLLGEGVDLFEIPVPASLAGRRLRDTGIGSRTGLSIVALQRQGEVITTLSADTVLPPDGVLLTLGSRDQRQAFAEAFERIG